MTFTLHFQQNNTMVRLENSSSCFLNQCIQVNLVQTLFI